MQFTFIKNKILVSLAEGISSILPKDKETYELLYWKAARLFRGKLSNEHFLYFYTKHFGIDYAFYDKKKILDIGCGPCGSLEWADNTDERIGLDPLADEYIASFTAGQKMKYVKSFSESIPFRENYFDVVTSFNSLDHVENIDLTIKEIYRVLKNGGLFLLITDVGHKATPTEPQEIGWDILSPYKTLFSIESEKHFERVNPRKIYRSLKEGVLFDHSNKTQRYGILSAKLKKI